AHDRAPLRRERRTLRHGPEAAASMAAIVELENVGFAFDGASTPLFDGVTLAVRRGELATVVGVSGAGKSTLLRVVAGLVAPSRGAVRQNVAVGAGRRPIAMVFQEPRLMPWRRVSENVALGL